MIQELDQALLRLNKPMDRNQPVEVMLKGMEEIQMFLMTHPDGDRELSEVSNLKNAAAFTPKQSNVGKRNQCCIEKYGHFFALTIPMSTKNCWLKEEERP